MIKTILNWFKIKKPIPAKIDLLHEEINALDLHDCANWRKAAVVYRLLAKEYRKEYNSTNVKNSRDEEHYFNIIQKYDELHNQFENAVTTLNKQLNKNEANVHTSRTKKKGKKKEKSNRNTKANSPE
jgi:hypothetical protein